MSTDTGRGPATGVARDGARRARRRLIVLALARAHARSGDRIALAGYLGSSAKFENAIAEFAVTYADVNEGDHRELADAVADGRVPAIPDT